MNFLNRRHTIETEMHSIYTMLTETQKAISLRYILQGKPFRVLKYDYTISIMPKMICLIQRVMQNSFFRIGLHGIINSYKCTYKIITLLYDLG